MNFWTLLFSFAPWIVFKLIINLPFFNEIIMTKIGIVLAALICGYQAMTGLQKGVILWGSVVFFGMSLVMVVFLTSMWYLVYLGVLANGTLAVVTWWSIAVKNPFTLAYAKGKVDRKYWNSPGFLQKNYMITAAWGIAFTIGLVGALIKKGQPGIPGYLFEIVNYVTMLFAILFTTHSTKPVNSLQTKIRGE